MRCIGLFPAISHLSRLIFFKFCNGLHFAHVILLLLLESVGSSPKINGGYKEQPSMYYCVYHLLGIPQHTLNMAGSPVATVVPPLAQSVQEMSVNGNEPPPQYFLKENSIQPMDSYLPSDPIPIIDISLLSSSSLSSKGGEEELEKLKSTLISWGCFQVLVSAYSKTL